MNKQIFVLSALEASNFRHESNWAAIQISTEAKKFPVLDKENLVGLLRLEVGDVSLAADHSLFDLRYELDPDRLKYLQTLKNEENKIFNEWHANRVLDFIDEHWDNIETLLVHCAAGISRSAGVASAICELKGGDPMYYFRHHYHKPNLLIYKTIHEVAQDRALKEGKNVEGPIIDLDDELQIRKTEGWA